MIERLDGRNWLIGGALLQFACWMVFASLGTFHFPISGVNPTQEQVGQIMIVFACIFVGSYACTWAPMAWVAVAEMFPQRHRSTAISLCASSNVSFSLPSFLKKETLADRS
jgi:SP family sugar:H+ symporter-like MFS transporter